MTASRKMYGGIVLFCVGMAALSEEAMHHVPLWGILATAGVSTGLFIYGMWVFYFGIAKGDEHLLKTGMKGTAVVVKAHRTNTVAQTGGFTFQSPYIWKYTLRVTVSGRQPYQATCSCVHANIPEGSTVKVAVSPRNRRNVAIDMDGSGSASRLQDVAGQVRRDRQRRTGPSMSGVININGREVDLATLSGHRIDLTNAAIARPDDLADDPNDAAPGPVDTAEELTKLADLRDRGVLTDSEFAVQKARLLGAG